jgi:hypothetical protein
MSFDFFAILKGNKIIEPRSYAELNTKIASILQKSEIFKLILIN